MGIISDNQPLKKYYLPLYRIETSFVVLVTALVAAGKFLPKQAPLVTLIGAIVWGVIAAGVTFRLCKRRPPFTNCRNLPTAMGYYSGMRRKKVFCFYEDNALAVWTFASLAFFTPQIYAAGFKAKRYDYAFHLTATVLLAVAIALALRLFQRACQLRPVAAESRSLL